MSFVDSLRTLRDSTALATIDKAKWDKRYPKGDPRGGQFAPGNGMGQFAGKDDGYYAKMYDWLNGDGMPAKATPPKGSIPHPFRDDKGHPVTINYPTKPSHSSTWDDPNATAVFTPGGAAPESLNGVPFTPWRAPTTLADWANVPGQDKTLFEPALFPKPTSYLNSKGERVNTTKSVGTGVLIVEPDGRVWLTEPTNHYGGYKATWPKGTLEKGLPMQANAIKEAWEETGLKVRIVGIVGDYERDTSIGRMYLAVREGGTPSAMGWESQSMRLTPIKDVPPALSREHDKKIAADLHAIMRSANIVKARPPSLKHLYLPVSNVNAASQNKKLDLIAELSKKGDVKGLLSLNFGSNNYAKAAAKATNEHLAFHGSPYKVKAPQKANSHPDIDKATNAVVSMSAGASAAPKTTAEGDPVKDADFESKHPRYPKGHPLGGQFMKKDAAGLTLPPDDSPKMKLAYETAKSAKAGSGVSEYMLEKAVENEKDPKVKAYAQQLLDDIGVGKDRIAAPTNETSPKPSPGEGKFTGKVFTPPPNDYHWFKQAHQAAVEGDMASLEEIEGTKHYKAPSLQAKLDEYIGTLKDEMMTADMGATVEAHVNATAAPDSKVGALGVAKPFLSGGAQQTLDIMEHAAKTNDKQLLAESIDASLDMEKHAPMNKGDWTHAVKYGKALRSAMDANTNATAVAERIVGPAKIADWTPAGGKPGGSNPGGLYKDKNGTLWLVKGNVHQQTTGNAVSDDRARNEVLASRLMAAAGIPAPEMQLVNLGGKFGSTTSGDGQLGVAVKMIDDVSAWMPTKANIAAAQKQFAVHAWLSNYDVMGAGNDNMMVSPTKGVINIDPGGAVAFRAQGLQKTASEFGSKVGEWDSMRSGMVNGKMVNPNSAKVFGPMTSDQLVESANLVGAIKPETIKQLVKTYGPADPAANDTLTKTLLARRDDILARAVSTSPMNTVEVGDGGKLTVVYKNPEFEAKIKRNADGTFKKKDEYGLTPPPKNMPYAVSMHAQAKLAQAGEAAWHDKLVTTSTTGNDDQKAYAKQLLADLKANAPIITGGTAANASALNAALGSVSPAAPVVPPGMPNFDSYKLALENTNAQSVNSKVDKIKSLAMAGDEKGLLALGYGTNNYAKKHHVAVANQALASLGSKYQVTPGQKPGTHPAVNLTGAAAATSSAPKEGTKQLLKVPDGVLPKPSYTSSNPDKLKANLAAMNYVHDLAKNGDYEALKSATFPEVVVENGKPTSKLTGKQIPMYEHPSKDVKAYHLSLMDSLYEIANPPAPLKLGADYKAKTLAALAREAEPTPLLAPMKSVPASNRWGFWVALGHSNVTDIDTNPKVNALSSAQVSAGKKAYAAMSSEAKAFATLVQNGAILHSYKSDAKSYSGHNLKSLSTAAIKAATPLPIGATTFRWQNMPDHMLKELKAMTIGTVIQGTAPMPTSYDPTATQHFGQHLVRFHAGPGAKAVHSHGSGKFVGEKEVTILPSQRFVLMKKVFTGQRWELDMLLLPPTKVD